MFKCIHRYVGMNMSSLVSLETFRPTDCYVPNYYTKELCVFLEVKSAKWHQNAESPGTSRHVVLPVASAPIHHVG